MIDQEQYEKDLRERQAAHLKRVRNGGRPFQPCMHDGCSQCHGTGIRANGTICVHMLCCPCPKCNPCHILHSVTQREIES